DGEVCVTAIETALQGRFRLTLRKDLRLDYPRAETPDHYMTMAMDPDLDQCVVRALRDMIVLLGEKRNLSREDAYTLCSLAADRLRVLIGDQFATPFAAIGAIGPRVIEV